MTWEEIELAYVAALDEEQRADALLAEAEERMNRLLADGVDGLLAYDIVGVGIADRRMHLAYGCARDWGRRLAAAMELVEQSDVLPAETLH